MLWLERHIACIPWRADAGAQGKGLWKPFSWFKNKVDEVPWSCQVWERKEFSPGRIPASGG